MSELRGRPAGTIRITADEHAVNTVLWPALRGVVRHYPEINIELVTDYGLTDIAAGRFDAGVRLGGIVAKDMIAVPIGPDMRMAAVAAPSYLAGRSLPLTPQDLTAHRCINLRLPTHGGLYAWEFEKDGREVTGACGGAADLQQRDADAVRGAGRAGDRFVTHDQVRPHLEDGSLRELLADWSPPFPGYHLYYPSLPPIRRGVQGRRRGAAIPAGRITEVATGVGPYPSASSP